MILSLPIPGFCPDGVFEPNASHPETNPRWQDLDNDSLANWEDPDSDNDGITDGTETGYTRPVTGCPGI